MKRYGKITLITLTALILSLALFIWIREAKAGTGSTHVIAVHKAMGNGFTTVGNAYAIITDLDNLDMYDHDGAVNTTIGTEASGGAAIELTADGQNTDWAMATAPALDTGKRYAITFYENATPTAGDTAVLGPLRYDPETGETFTDSSPIKGARVKTRND
jgi:drug/metabolite transporter superfamily protein YnfA